MIEIKRAITDLIINEPFFGSLIMKANLIENTTWCQTMATDGKDIFYNPEFVKTLNKRELVFILCHEIMHKIWMHCQRMQAKKYDKQLYNIAADYIINWVLDDNPYMARPACALYNPKYDDSWTAERVYEDLKNTLQNQQNNSGGNGNGNGAQNIDLSDAPDHLAPGKPLSEAEAAELEDDIRIQVENAKTALKNAGRAGSSRLLGVIDKIIAPKVCWRKQLREFLQATGKDDTSFRRPRRRTYPLGLYLPIYESEQMGDIIIAVDTSGSIYSHQKSLITFSAEINAIVDELKPKSVKVAYCDTQIVGDIDEYTEGEPIKLTPRGGGGTRFSPVMDWIIEQGERPAALIYFTDLYCSDFGRNPEIPVLWANYDGAKKTTLPFGREIVIED